MAHVISFLRKAILNMFLPPPISPELASIAKAICKEGDWAISNLRLQKMLYLCQMIKLGRTGAPLINEDFQAWMYGPVIPNLYARLKAYGAGAIGDRFYNAKEMDFSDLLLVKEICAATKNLSDAQLVALTHAPKSAWSKNYLPRVRDIVIPKSDIIDEYRARNAK